MTPEDRSELRGRIFALELVIGYLLTYRLQIAENTQASADAILRDFDSQCCQLDPAARKAARSRLETLLSVSVKNALVTP